ncbi:hypothetical protein OEZ85_009167 [Tetradesmus obliquus]|uniref:HpcH/HpaI aldolase/citrate lyase domain-containing protein n=1 Tax=Tetradesmus obliquus TaxID=3088 RepID=A0ABY8TLD4_TETOB|nr:hypothetical protein OEZ85_009167 [Tetradesmus obliquus]
MLYVPGTAERKLRKAATEISVDSIVMDCEDGVALNMKDVARATIALMLDDLDFCPSSEAAVRINPVSSGMAADDLVAVLSAKRVPDALVVPKVEGPDEVHWLVDRVQQLLAKQRQRQQLGQGSGGGEGSGSRQGRQLPLALVTMCESAMALLDLRHTFEAALSYGAPGPLQLQACILGGDDMAASLGATRSADNGELAYARGQFLVTCRAMQVQAIDIVKIDLSEAGMRGLAAEARQAALAGWSGKQVIHPKQVPVVQVAFSPSAADVQAAMRLLTAYTEHQRQGQGAFIFEGKMIDAPTVLQARNVLALADRFEPSGADML